ncbi:unnamed protein product [Linum trigynum]|uniref:Uncharacterized protein n=1 Tax=Linum trigynum TaxID=586398 RepID=A0AAV2E2R4_9ROSI
MAPNFKVEITSAESVKPSSPTPDHLRAHNLTILDQTAPHAYVPLCLFFPRRRASSYDQDSFAETLRDSLSNTLSVYYPLAGRYKDAFSVDCNDAGAHFVRARVGCHLSDALGQETTVDEDRLLPLLPCRPQGRRVDSDGELVLLAVQVSFFECGGVSVGVCAWHGVSDACTLACFLRTWSGFAMKVAALHEGGNGGVAVVVRDCTDVFPPRDLSVASECLERFQAAVATPGTRIKRFVFGRDEVAALRRDIEAASSQRPSRVQAVSAVIWAAAIKIARDKKEGRRRYHIAAMTTNLRSRMKPALPEQAMGNLVQIPVFAEWPVDNDDDENDYGAVAGKLRESVKMVNDENMREATGSGFLDVLRRFVEEYAGGNLLAISSWCRFPFYEVDFGIGKPVWMCFFTMCYNLVVLLDAEDGVGVEAWVTLSEEDMSKFEKDVGVLKYAACSKSIVGVRH